MRTALRSSAANRARRRPRRGQAGQALVETAIVVVFAMSLFVGVYAVSVAISDSTSAGLATRSGARFGAQVGNNNYTAGTTDTCQTGNTDPCGVDKQIVATVADGIQGLRFTTIRRIVIYQPGGASQCASGSTPNSPYIVGERADIYTPGAGGTWTPSTANGGYTLDQRLQLHPNEGAIGVQLEFDYKSPTPMVQVTLADHTEYTVNCFAPSSH